MINIKILPELKKLIPPLTPEEYNQLEANCIQDGIRDPIVLWKRLIDKEHPDFSFKCYDYEEDEDICLENISIADGCFDCSKCNAGVAGWEYEHILVDGHNRFEISEKHGLKYNVSYLDLYDLDDIKLWMIDNQKGRRNLSDFVKFELSDVKAEILRKRGKVKQIQTLGGYKHDASVLSIVDKTDDILPPHNTRKEQAADLGWSTGKVAMATVVKNKADEETKEKLRRNEISINQVYNELRETKPKAIATLYTGQNEWYTPSVYIESARAVMGNIDVDPASNENAQKIVKAKKYYTIETNGLLKDWIGNVWMNPPYSGQEIKAFILKLCAEINFKNVNQAIVLTNNNTDTSWFHSLAAYSSAICFTKGRINFYRGEEKSFPTNGQAFFYVGKNTNLFNQEFSKYGLIMKKYD